MSDRRHVASGDILSKEGPKVVLARILLATRLRCHYKKLRAVLWIAGCLSWRLVKAPIDKKM